MKFLTAVLLFPALAATAQVKPKVVTECTVEYSVALGEDEASAVTAPSITLYIKGWQSRLDFISPSFKQVKYHDARTKSVVILQDLGATRVRRDLDSAKWARMNEKYSGLSVVYTDETRTILGYECKRANITLKDGSSYFVYYAPAIVPSTREYEYQFRTIPGFVLEYEMEEGAEKKVRYTAVKINLSPVPAAKFEVPKAGYRVL